MFFLFTINKDGGALLYGYTSHESSDLTIFLKGSILFIGNV